VCVVFFYWNQHAVKGRKQLAACATSSKLAQISASGDAARRPAPGIGWLLAGGGALAALFFLRRQ